MVILKSKSKNSTNIKYLFQKQNIDIDKVIVSNKVSFGENGFKYFVGYKDDNKIRPLCIYLPKMSAYRKNFDETKYMSFLIKYDEF